MKFSFKILNNNKTFHENSKLRFLFAVKFTGCFVLIISLDPGNSRCNTHFIDGEMESQQRTKGSSKVAEPVGGDLERRAWSRICTSSGKPLADS